jgi:RNA polymerase sigma-70 factor (ECF subfamily)
MEAPQADARRPPDRDIATTYRNHASSAHRVAYRVLRDHELAADAVQEAFLSLWLLRARYGDIDGSGDSYGLLRVLVHRRAVDILRRRSAGPSTVALDSAAEQFSGEQTGVDEQVVAALDTARVHAAIRSLTPHKRDALVLAYVQGRTHDEIATALNVPIGTVKSRLARARNDLKRLLPADLVSERSPASSPPAVQERRTSSAGPLPPVRPV